MMTANYEQMLETAGCQSSAHSNVPGPVVAGWARHAAAVWGTKGATEDEQEACATVVWPHTGSVSIKRGFSSGTRPN